LKQLPVNAVARSIRASQRQVHTASYTTDEKNKAEFNHAGNALCHLVQFTGIDKGKGPLCTIKHSATNTA
jgi:hypothetical protein